MWKVVEADADQLKVFQDIREEKKRRWDAAQLRHKLGSSRNYDPPIPLPLLNKLHASIGFHGGTVMVREDKSGTNWEGGTNNRFNASERYILLSIPELVLCPVKDNGRRILVLVDNECVRDVNTGGDACECCGVYDNGLLEFQRISFYDPNCDEMKLVVAYGR